MGYDPNYEEAVAGFQSFWSGLYPIFMYGAELQMPVEGFGEIYNSNLFAGLQLPFDFSSGIYSNKLNINSTFYLSSWLYPKTKHVPIIRTSIFWNFLQKKAKRDINPNLGIGLSSGWIYGLDSSFYNFIYADSNFYLPGFWENHGFHLVIDAEHNFDNAQLMLNPMQLPRGMLISEYNFPFLINTSIEYTLPIAYPDLDIKNILYISRISLNGFFDSAFSNSSIATIFSKDTSIMMTTGVEIFFDFNLFNTTMPLRGGMRVLYDFTRNKYRIEETVTLLGFDI